VAAPANHTKAPHDQPRTGNKIKVLPTATQQALIRALRSAAGLGISDAGMLAERLEARFQACEVLCYQTASLPSKPGLGLAFERAPRRCQLANQVTGHVPLHGLALQSMKAGIRDLVSTSGRPANGVHAIRRPSSARPLGARTTCLDHIGAGGRVGGAVREPRCASEHTTVRPRPPSAPACQGRYHRAAAAVYGTGSAMRIAKRSL